MGCFQSTLNVTGTCINVPRPPNSPATLIMRHIRKNTRQLDISSSKRSRLFVDKYDIIWKISTSELVEIAELIQRNNTLVMSLPENNYILKPTSVTRLTPHVLCICQPMAFCDLHEWGCVPFKWETVTIFLKQVAEGIHWLHDLNVCHGDIKPENIVLQGLHARIIDFDFVASLEDTSQCHTKMFKPPREIVSEWNVANSVLSKRCDVYAFGKTILFMLFRLELHRGNVPVSWWKKSYIARGHAHSFEALEGKWADIAFECCRRCPPERIPTSISSFELADDSKRERDDRKNKTENRNT